MASLKAGEHRVCEACGTAMIGAVHHNTGKVAPLVEEGSRGNIVVWRTKNEGHALTYGIVTSAESLMFLRNLSDYPLFLNHFANCPEARRFHREVA